MASAYKPPMTRRRREKLRADLLPIIDAAINRALLASAKARSALSGWGYVKGLDDNARTPWEIE